MVEEKREEVLNSLKDNRNLYLRQKDKAPLSNADAKSSSVDGLRAADPHLTNIRYNTLMKTLTVSLFLFLVIALLTFFGYNAYKNADNYIKISKEISSQKGANELFEDKLNAILEKLSFGTYDKHSQETISRGQLEIFAEQTYQKSLTYLYYFFTSIMIFLILFFFLDRELLIIYIGFAGIVSLVFALISPLIMMIVYQAFPILGEVTLSFESKSILGTIEKMYHDKNYVIASLVLLFSIMIPFVKSLVLLLYGFFKESGITNRLVRIVDKIGKWSMADVFIVAVLVVFFSTKQDIHTSIKLEVGLYFFVGYVLLSMLGTSLIGERKLSKKGDDE